MDINLVKNAINGVNFVKIGHFWGQNDATGQNSGKFVKKLSLKVSKNYCRHVQAKNSGKTEETHAI